MLNRKKLFHNKFRILLFLGLLNFSCSDNTKIVHKQKLDFWEETFEKIEGEIPNKIKSENFLKVYRIGSIEFSNDASVLCIPKKEIKSERIHCSYYSLSLYGGSNNQRSQPQLIGHNFILEGLVNVELNLEKLKKIKTSDLDDYLKSKPADHSGEWHCGNIYLIKVRDMDEYYMLDFNSSRNEKNYFQSLYRQISPSEYFQSFSLDKTCADQQLLYQKLINKKYNSDTLKFKIDYSINNGYW